MAKRIIAGLVQHVSVRWLSLILLAAALVMAKLAYGLQEWPYWSGFLANLATTLVGSALTISVVDVIVERDRSRRWAGVRRATVARILWDLNSLLNTIVLFCLAHDSGIVAVVPGHPGSGASADLERETRQKVLSLFPVTDAAQAASAIEYCRCRVPQLDDKSMRSLAARLDSGYEELGGLLSSIDPNLIAPEVYELLQALHGYLRNAMNVQHMPDLGQRQGPDGVAYSPLAMLTEKAQGDLLATMEALYRELEKAQQDESHKPASG
ncbi:MAG: hypothetical protein ACYC5O_01435 [Anaerolineae bacterium]